MQVRQSATLLQIVRGKTLRQAQLPGGGTRFRSGGGSSAAAAANAGSALPKREEAGIPAGCGRIDRDCPFGCEAVQVSRPARLRPGAAQALAAERLRTDDGADRIAVDVAVADPEAAQNVVHRLIDPAVNAGGQRVSGRGDLVEHRVKMAGAPADHVQNRPKHLAIEPRRTVDLERARGEKTAVLGPRRQATLI